MIREALADAGLTLADVDGICCSGIATGIAEYLDLRPRFVDGTFVGGSSFELHVEHAAAAIAAGLCDVVVGVYASTPRLDRRLDATAASFGPMGPDVAGEWEAPYGSMVPMTSYALAADRHMAQFGTSAEQLAQIAVDARRWAAMNPRARYRDPITVDDVLASPVIASPLHQLDCCLRTDGAGAYVLTSAERARDLAQPPVHVLGAATATDHWVISQMPDLTVTPGARSGPEAFAARASPPTTSTCSRPTTRSPSPRSSTSRISASAPRARGERSWRTASSGPEDPCRRTPTAAGSRTRTPGSTASSYSSRPSASSAAPPLTARSTARRSRSRTAAAACCRPPRPWCWARRRRCDHAAGTAASDEARPFWDATRAERLVLPWCTECEVAIWYPRTVCPLCLGSAVEWRDDAGGGTVYAASVHTRPGPGRDADDGPYVVVLVDLDAGVRMMSNVVGCPPGDVTAGMRVTVAWEPLADGRHLPVFRALNQAV